MQLSKKQIMAGLEVDIPANWKIKEKEGLRSIKYNKTTKDFEVFVVGIFDSKCSYKKGEVTQKASTLEEIVETTNSRYSLDDVVVE